MHHDDELMHTAINIIHTRDEQLMHKQTNNPEYRKLEDYVLQTARHVVNNIPDNVARLFKELNDTKETHMKNHNVMEFRQKTTKQETANDALFHSYLVKMEKDVRERIANEHPEIIRQFSGERSSPMIFECIKYALFEKYPMLGTSIREKYKNR